MMRDTIPAEELLHKAYAVGQYYGFTPLGTITSKMRGAARIKTADSQSLTDIGYDSNAETVVNFLKQCQNASCSPTSRQPLFIWHTNIAHGRKAPKKAIIQFHALGTDRAIADAVVIRPLIALTRDLFHEEPILRINSMGDKETRGGPRRRAREIFHKTG